LPLVNGFVDDALRNMVPSVNVSAHECHISAFVISGSVETQLR